MEQSFNFLNAHYSPFLNFASSKAGLTNVYGFVNDGNGVSIQGIDKSGACTINFRWFEGQKSFYVIKLDSYNRHIGDLSAQFNAFMSKPASEPQQEA